MDEMVDVLPHHGDAREREEDPIAEGERPGDHEVLVSGPGQCATRLLDVPVEALDQRLGGLVAVARRAAQVELCLAHRQGNPPGHARYELRQVTQRERFLVRLPRSLVARHSLEQAPRGRHLLVEFGEERFGNAHESLGRLRWDRPTEALGEPNRGRTLRPGPDSGQPRCPRRDQRVVACECSSTHSVNSSR